MILGFITSEHLGPYAAARRLVFAVVALGLAVPAVLGPAIARGWAEGSESARRQVGLATDWLLALAIPAALGLGLTGDRWMPLLFGQGYREGGPLLAVIAARLPFLLVASLAQTVLVACRCEILALKWVAGVLGLAAVLIPLGLMLDGPVGMAWGVVSVEMAGAAIGWRIMARMGAAPWPSVGLIRIAAACVAMSIVSIITRSWPLGLSCLISASAYAAIWSVSLFRPRPERSPA